MHHWLKSLLPSGADGTIILFVMGSDPINRIQGKINQKNILNIIDILCNM